MRAANSELASSGLRILLLFDFDHLIRFHGVDDLAKVLEDFDTTVIMKIGREMPNVLAALERTGLTDKAVFASRATMEDERVERDVRRAAGDYGDCYWLAIVQLRLA